MFPLIRIALLSVCLLSACQTVSLQPPPALQGVEALQVEGRHGWLHKRRLKFGEFQTDPVRGASVRSRSSGSGLSLDLGALAYQIAHRVEQVEQRVQLRVQDAQGAQAEVQATGRLEAKSREWATRLLAVEIGRERRFIDQNSFIGSVLLDGGKAWRFALQRPQGEAVSEWVSLGWALDEGGRQLLILPLRGLQAQDGRRFDLGQLAPPQGFEFELDGRSIGAVSLVNAGQVWLQPGLEPELRLLLAALSSALLLREELAR